VIKLNKKILLLVVLLFIQRVLSMGTGNLKYCSLHQGLIENDHRKVENGLSRFDSNYCRDSRCVCKDWPLLYSAQDLDMIRLLIRYGADINEVVPFVLDAPWKLKFLYESGADLSYKNDALLRNDCLYYHGIDSREKTLVWLLCKKVKSNFCDELEKASNFNNLFAVIAFLQSSPSQDLDRLRSGFSFLSRIPDFKEVYSIEEYKSFGLSEREARYVRRVMQKVNDMYDTVAYEDMLEEHGSVIHYLHNRETGEKVKESRESLLFF